MCELVLPTVSVPTEDATMKRISDFFGGPQPKRPTSAARQEKDVTGPCSVLPMYIGHAVGNSKLTDRKHLTILDNAWTPQDDFVWPYTERMDSSKLMRKYLGKQHSSGVYSAFVYSALKKGLLCKACALCASHEAGGVKLDRLVKLPSHKNAHVFTKIAKTKLGTSGRACEVMPVTTVLFLFASA